MKSEIMIIGRILGVHGIQGELKVLPLTDDPQRFFDLEEILIEKENIWEPMRILSMRHHKKNILLFLEGVKDRNQAEAMMGKKLAVPRSQAVSLEADEFFIEDLLGITVFNEQLLLGELVDVMQTGGIDVYIIKGSEKVHCVPARKIYFKSIDIKNNRIDATIPKEILEL